MPKKAKLTHVESDVREIDTSGKAEGKLSEHLYDEPDELNEANEANEVVNEATEATEATESTEATEANELNNEPDQADEPKVPKAKADPKAPKAKAELRTKAVPKAPDKLDELTARVVELERELETSHGAAEEKPIGDLFDLLNEHSEKERKWVKQQILVTLQQSRR